MDVGAGVAVEGQHPVPVEAVIARPVGRQVGVLDRADPHRAGRLLQFGGRQLVLVGPARDHVPRPLNGLVEQLGQFHRPALAGPEHFPVRPEHVTEPDVHGLGPRGQPTGQTGGGKDHLEVLGLGQAHHVHEQVGTQTLDAVPDRRQVGGGVVVTAD